MKIATRNSIRALLVATGLALAAAPAANAQVQFQGSFPLPHGRISVGVVDPLFPLRSFVPDGYSVYDDPQYGYGFYDDDDWVPCQRFGARWVIAGPPVFIGRHNFRFRSAYPYRSDVRRFGSYRGGFDGRFDSRRDRGFRERFDDDRWSRGGREFRRDGRDRRGGRDSRRDSRHSRW